LHGWQLGSFLQLVDLKQRKKEEEGIIQGHKKRGEKKAEYSKSQREVNFFYLEQ
jgi:hypothetical protein